MKIAQRRCVCVSVCSHQVQQQAMLVLQENQLLIEQLEALNAKNEAEHSKHLSEGL